MGKDEKIVEQKANEKHEADEEQKGDDHAEDKQVVVPVSTTQKERPSLLQSTSNHSVSSNFGNQFINSPNVSLIEQAVKELKQADPSTVILASIKSQVPSLVKDYLGSSLPDAFQKVLQSHTEELKKELSKKRDYKDVIEELVQAHVINEVKKFLPKFLPQGKKTKKRRFNESESSKKASIAKESSKGKSLAKTSKSGKSMTTEEPVEEPIFYKALDDVEQTFDDKIDTTDETQADVVPKIQKKDWFKDSPNPEPWFNEMVQAEKPPLTFDELMSTPIDFSTFTINRLKLDKITREILVSPVFNLLKGTYKSCVLEYNMEECYRALTDQLKWANLKGHKIPVDMCKPLPLQDKDGRLVEKRSRYGYLKEIVVRRVDKELYKFKGGNFSDLHLNDIEDMLMLIAQNKLYNLDGNVNVDFVTALKMLLNFKFGYNKDIPLRKWTPKDEKRTGIMVKKIDDRLFKRWILRSLEVLDYSAASSSYVQKAFDYRCTYAGRAFSKDENIKIVTNRFTLIVLSALRRSGKENKQLRSVLTEPKVHVKMEMEIPYSSKVKTHQRPQEKEGQYAVSREDQYAVLDIWHVNILEDIKRGPYSKKLQYAIILITASRLKKVMADKGKKSSMETFAPNDKVDYYSEITSIIVNGKNAYELKGKFLDDLHNNAFSGERRIDPNLLTKDIMRFQTYEDYKDHWIYEWNKNVPWVYDKPWLDNGIWKELKPVKHTCKPFNYKTGCSEWPTCSWREDGYCNGGNLLEAYHIGNLLHYQDLEWYEALEDIELKDKALRNKAIMKGLISNNESSNDCWKR
ncbi:hypothetical protein Tco_0770498 [Tanacetum coccineum]|uniref:Uncharacterized protein n=1 Tax=Tanacetum coccineum TaxID=301880 RepID=A0ABQ4ZFC6_9ASTR